MDFTNKRNYAYCPLDDDGIDYIGAFITPKEIRQALEDKTIELYLQPTIDLRTNEIVSYEGLSRFKKYNPRLLFECVMEAGITEVFEYLTKLGYEAMYRVKAPVYINLTYIDIYNTNVYYPYLELTENVSYDNHIEELQKLCNRCHVAMDDFGKDYASWKHIPKLNLCKIKIDKAIIDELLIEDLTIKNKYIDLLMNIRLLSIRWDIPICCEGVEVKDQLDILNSIGFEYGQGYYWSPPKPMQDFFSSST